MYIYRQNHKSYSLVLVVISLKKKRQYKKFKNLRSQRYLNSWYSPHTKSWRERTSEWKWQEYKESLDKEKISKQDSSNVVNDASEPTPLTDLDGGD